jgi:hypothetical protein
MGACVWIDELYGRWWRRSSRFFSVFFAGVLFFYGGPGRCLVGMYCVEGLRDYTMGWLYDCMIFRRSVGCIYVDTICLFLFLELLMSLSTCN